ncbi:ATP-binding cassette domain-containing protein [Reichenbachiella sp. MALMAid0571]|uniref:ATP-binding cassette domain-containing protein n=1 Tax=Reichenbachiella sp. MALMAid0571 TaxID=3143939 RepID=UPI0032DFCAE2
MPEINYSQTSFSYKGKIVLSDISFSIKDKQHCGIVGAIGSGKTMLLKSLTGILPLREGARTFRVDGVEVSPYEFSCLVESVESSDSNKFFKPASHFYQQRYQSLEDDESRSLLVKEYLELLRIDLSDTNVSGIIAKGRITELLDRKLIHLSSGQRKRLQLTIAITKKPRILLLDWPYTGLDSSTRAYLNDWLQEVTDQYGIQLIIVANRKDLPDFIDTVVELENRPKTASSDSNLALDQLIESWKRSASQLRFDSMICMKEVLLGYGDVQILKGVNWEVKQGELIGLQGENGSGKSSLLSLVYGDNPLAYNKEIYLFDRKRGTGESIWDIKKNIGFISSEFHLYMSDNITCEKLVATGYFDQLFIPRKLTELEQVTIDLFFDYYGVQDLKKKFFDQISIGEQRLVLLIRAFIKNPLLLLLDEPFHGFDENTIAKSNLLIEKMVEYSGTTLVFISHDKQVMPDIINKYYLLQEGTIHQIN